MFLRIGRAAFVAAALSMIAGTGTVLGHESRSVGDLTFVVGFL